MAEDSYYTHHLDEIFEEFAKVCDWFDTLGFSYTRTRYGAYEKSFRQIQELAKQPTLDTEELTKAKSKFDNAYLEVNEVIRVYDALKTAEASDIFDQIKKITSGAEYRGETDQSRDFLFELSVAARFIKAGFNTMVTGISDVTIALNEELTLYVECKRVKSARRIGRNISKATKQIKKRVEATHQGKGVGIVALNLTDLVTAPKNIYPDQQEAGTQIHRFLLKKLISEHTAEIQHGFSVDSLGLMIESSMMFYLSKRYGTAALSYSRHTSYFDYGNGDLFETFPPILSNQDIV